MTQEWYKSLALPKWPGLVVVGSSITPEQAMEVLIRTDALRFSCNDKEFVNRLCDLFDIPRDKEYGWISLEVTDVLREKLGCLSLHYLENSRIVSAWIGGPHGWCDWDGTIGCSNFNIGKWPSVEQVREDWTAIAQAFPYLSLKSQLFSGETCEEGVVPVVEFEIVGGKVEVQPPQGVLCPLKDNLNDFISNWAYRSERGVTPELFKRAVEHTYERVNSTSKEIRSLQDPKERALFIQSLKDAQKEADKIDDRIRLEAQVLSSKKGE